MPESIRVSQFHGNNRDDEWYICRGDGNKTVYLRNDLTWHSNVMSGGFFWKSQSEANIAAQAAEQKDDDSTPPP